MFSSLHLYSISDNFSSTRVIQKDMIGRKISRNGGGIESLSQETVRRDKPSSVVKDKAQDTTAKGAPPSSEKMDYVALGSTMGCTASIAVAAAGGSINGNG